MIFIHVTYHCGNWALGILIGIALLSKVFNGHIVAIPNSKACSFKDRGATIVEPLIKILWPKVPHSTDTPICGYFALSTFSIVITPIHGITNATAIVNAKAIIIEILITTAIAIT